MKCISLLTDFGLQDGYAGVMKGVILGIAPDARVIDITHLIPPQNILHGALVLAAAYRYFPAGSIHVAVVDPGVGTERAGIAAKIGNYYYVAPDNGLLTLILERAEQDHKPIHMIKLENRALWLPNISQTFHGRDIFAPVAAHLANGVALEEFGSEVVSPVRIKIPRPVCIENGWHCEVLWIDGFGNAITNLAGEALTGKKVCEVRAGGSEITRFVDTFGKAEPETLVALIDSSGYLSISKVNGSAAKELKLHPGDRVEVIAV